MLRVPAIELFSLLLLSLAAPQCDAFSVIVPSLSSLGRPSQSAASRRETLLAAAGGGFGSSNNKSESSSLVSLKPKQQWDRYMTMSKDSDATTVRVGVRKADDESTTSEWLLVGGVRSSGGVDIDSAVARQRSLIADVSTIT